MPVTRLTWKPVEGAQAYRLLVYDRTDARTIFDETVTGVAHTVLIPDDRRSHDLLMRFRVLRGNAWDDWTDFRPLPLDVVLGEPHEPLPILSITDDPGLLLMFTVDTECSILRQPNPNPDRVVDEQIFGDFNNGRAPGGIGLHMDLLEHFGFRGCFFLDVLMEYRYGQRALERTIEAIAERGHEIELHVHADHFDCSSDPQVARLSGALGTQDRELFRRAIELSIDLFERRVGRRPIAYRAGGYRIADMHFPILEEFGIQIDSSVQPYFNSRVSDWMRTRTQPFWVGGVLEVPPTLLLLNEDPDAWETRGFLPNPDLGDPVSTLSVEPGAPPLVATFVSHSFQLLRCRQTTESDAFERFAEQLRLALPGDLADRLLRWSPAEVRTFGEEVDDLLVAPVAGILRRISDRRDARCATYADLARVIDRFWPIESYSPVDPIPTLNRQSGATGVTGTRVFGRELLSHLAGDERVDGRGCSCATDGVWLEGLECCPTTEFRERIDSAAAKLESGQTLRLRLRTLGVAAAGQCGTLPALAELLFPVDAIRAVANEMGVKGGDVVAWDASTFLTWVEEQGFEVLRKRRLPRHPEELAAVDRFAKKLRWFAPDELRTGVLEVELSRFLPKDRSSRSAAVPIVELVSDETIRTAALVAEVDPVLLPAATVELYESMRPGQELRLEMAVDPAPASKTTILLALMRAGFEVLEENVSGYRLIRPVELSDVRRFAGLD